jgi:uncharacterized damage-inducible protein DinB
MFLMSTASTKPLATPALTCDELLRHNEGETAKWRDFFDTYPETLGLPAEFAQMHEVRGVLLHIFAVELIYAERIAGIARPRLDYADFPSGSLDELFGNHDKAMEHLRGFLARGEAADWDAVIKFETKTSGTLQGSKRKCFVHLFLHSVRHWAQLATFLRESGFKQEWGHDFIFSNVIP